MYHPFFLKNSDNKERLEQLSIFPTSTKQNFLDIYTEMKSNPEYTCSITYNRLIKAVIDSITNINDDHVDSITKLSNKELRDRIANPKYYEKIEDIWLRAHFELMLDISSTTQKYSYAESRTMKTSLVIFMQVNDGRTFSEICLGYKYMIDHPYVSGYIHQLRDAIACAELVIESEKKIAAEQTIIDFHFLKIIFSFNRTKIAEEEYKQNVIKFVDAHNKLRDALVRA